MNVFSESFEDVQPKASVAANTGSGLDLAWGLHTLPQLFPAQVLLGTEALERFEGTVVAISHDRYFLDRIADRIVVVADGAAHAFEGGWSANLARV